MKTLKPVTSSYLPPEILLDILSRVPIRTVFTCKCVCKSWLDLLESPEFARSHLSKSVPGLLIFHCLYTKVRNVNIIKIFELQEDSSPELELHYRRVLELDLGFHYPIYTDGFRTCFNVEGSANGLVFLRSEYNDHFICNPITRELIRIPKPERSQKVSWEISCGFGMSRLTNQYKVVRIFDDLVSDPTTGSSISMPVCQVYTIGTESWRDIVNTPREALKYSRGWFSFGKLLNGNLHWLAMDSARSCWISCFDLETEVFTEFRAPFAELEPIRRWGYLALGVLGDHLCVSDNSSWTEISIYLMNGYGDENYSWSREYVISKGLTTYRARSDVVYVVKAFVDGDILMVGHDSPFFEHYSSRTKAMELIDVVYNEYVSWFEGDRECCFEAILYTPSFISLRDFETKNAKVLELVCSMS